MSTVQKWAGSSGRHDINSADMGNQQWKTWATSSRRHDIHSADMGKKQWKT